MLFFLAGDSTISGGVGGKGLVLRREVFLLLFFFLGGGRRSRAPRIDSFCGVLWVVENIDIYKTGDLFPEIIFWSISTFSLEVDDYTPQKSNLHHETLKNDGVWSQVENNLLLQGKNQPFSGGPSFSESWVNGATKRKPSFVKARESRQIGVSLNGGTPISEPKIIIYAPGVCWGSLRLLDLLV